MTLYRGDDTNSFGSGFITINLATTTPVSISTAIFKCGVIKKVFDNPIFPLEVSLSAAETKKLQQETVCYLAVYDDEGLKRTCEGSLIFETNSQVV